MNPIDYEPPSGLVKGRVLVNETSQPIPGAVIEARQNEEYRVAVANLRGEFELADVGAGAWEIKTSRTNYEMASGTFFMPSPVSTITAGDLYMSEKARLPDLVVSAVDRRSLASNPSNFHATGDLVVTVRNVGRYATNSGFDIVVYEDRDNNRSFNAEVDQALGYARIEQVIPSGGFEKVTMPINAQLRFRDAPIRVRIDIGNEVLEVLEDNNDAGTCELAGCGE